MPLPAVSTITEVGLPISLLFDTKETSSAMASFFSFFSSRKTSKRDTGTPTSPVDQEPAASSSTIRTPPHPDSGGSSPCSSLTSMPSGRLHDASHRGESDEPVRHPVSRQNDLPQEPAKLDLPSELRPPQRDGAGTQIGLSGASRRPVFMTEELEKMEQAELSCKEVMLGWRWFGQALRAKGERPSPAVVIA